MGKLKQEVIKAVKEAGGRSFPVMGENDFKGRLDRVEAILEVQSGIVLEESPEPAKKSSKKSGFARFGLLIVLVMGMFASTVMARQLFNLVDEDRTSVFSVDGNGGSATVTVAKVVGDVTGAITPTTGDSYSTAQVDTNATTVTTVYTPVAIGDLLIGNTTNTPTAWFASGTTTNDWLKFHN